MRLANSAGRALLAHDRTSVGEELRESLAGRTQAFSVTAIEVAGMPPHWLAIQAPRQSRILPRVATAAARWELTARQIEVPDLLAQAKPNKSVAVELGCSVRTAEIQVSAILARAGVSSRAELIAKLWEMAT